MASPPPGVTLPRPNPDRNYTKLQSLYEACESFGKTMDAGLVPTPTDPPPVFASVPRIDLTAEELSEQFNRMLRAPHVVPMAAPPRPAGLQSTPAKAVTFSAEHRPPWYMHPALGLALVMIVAFAAHCIAVLEFHGDRHWFQGTLLITYTTLLLGSRLDQVYMTMLWGLAALYMLLFYMATYVVVV